MYNHSLRTLTLLPILLPLLASADDSPDLEEVVVVGSKNESVVIAGSGIAIGRLELERFDYIDVHQVMSSVPGVYVREEDGFGLRPNIGIRGAAAERSQKITIMEDGILITPAPYSAPAAYYVPNISRMSSIEVLKGPSAISHGPHTVGGAVNFVTSLAPRSKAAEVELSAGSDRYHKIQASYGDQIGQTRFLIEGSQFGSDGFKVPDIGGDTGFARSELNIKIQHVFKTAKEQQLTLKLGWADEDADETYLGLTDTDFHEDPTRRYAASQLAKFLSSHTTFHLNHGVQWSDNLTFNTKVYWHEFDREWNKLDGFIEGPGLQSVLIDPERFLSQYQLLTGARDSDFTEADVLDVTNNDRSFNSKGIHTTATLDLAFDEVSHEFEFGIRYHFDEVDRNHKQRGYYMTNNSLNWDGLQRGAKTLNHQESKALSFYIEDNVSWRDFRLSVGVRHEDIRGVREDYLSASSVDSDQNNTSFGLGALWQATDNLSLIAGVYQGFSPAAPGSGVEPEETINYEYGARYFKDNIRIELIGFFSDYDNLIGRCRVSDTDCGAGDEFNGGSIEVAGAELVGGASTEISNGLSVSVDLSYTYTESAFQESFLSGFSQWGLVSKGDQLPYLPSHVGRVQIGLEAPTWQIYAALKAQSKTREKPGRDEIANDFHGDERNILDITANWQVRDNWEVQMVVQNASDEVTIVSHRPYGARPNKPRTIIGRVKYTL